MKPLLLPKALLLIGAALTLACAVKTDPNAEVATNRPMETTQAVPMETHRDLPLEVRPNHETPHMAAMRQIVYTTRDGHEFHRADCRYLKHTKDPIPMPRREAESKNYMPCKICMP